MQSIRQKNKLTGLTASKAVFSAFTFYPDPEDNTKTITIKRDGSVDLQNFEDMDEAARKFWELVSKQMGWNERTIPPT